MVQYHNHVLPPLMNYINECPEEFSGLVFSTSLESFDGVTVRRKDTGEEMHISATNLIEHTQRSLKEIREWKEKPEQVALQMEIDGRHRLEVYLWKIKRYVLVLHLVIIALAIALGMAASQ